MKRYLGIFLTLLSMTALTLLANIPMTYAGTTTASTISPIAVTHNGAVRGMIKNDTQQFLGIPFAAPPVGDLRWKAPQPAASWKGIRDATQFGSICTQFGSALSGISTPGASGSEDCLYLNVYTPKTFHFDLPVMIWIHGGAFTGGAGSIYDPTQIVTKGNVIVVTINYRLGPLGFLALPGLSSETATGSSGDYGLQDQQAAMRWVRANIFNFGGNPFNTTIFGESAGGESVCDNIASPLVKGLFERSIIESGLCPNAAPTLATSQSNGTGFATSLKCSGTTSAIVACMRAVPASTLVTNAALNPTRLPLSFAPNVDGFVLPQQVKAAFSSGEFNHVPVIQGSNRNEFTIFVLAEISATGVAIPLTATRYALAIQATFGAAAAQVLANYPVTSTVSPDQALANVITDATFACPSRTASGLLSQDVPTFAYEFNDPNPFEVLQIPNVSPPDFTLGDAHATELADIFQASPSPLTPAQLKLSNQMIQYWTRFATTGNPNSFSTPFWPHYNTQTDLFQSLTSAGTGPHPFSTFSDEHQCGFWSTLGI